jgi:hypothetical protein
LMSLSTTQKVFSRNFICRMEMRCSSLFIQILPALGSAPVQEVLQNPSPGSKPSLTYAAPKSEIQCQSKSKRKRTRNARSLEEPTVLTRQPNRDSVTIGVSRDEMKPPMLSNTRMRYSSVLNLPETILNCPPDYSRFGTFPGQVQSRPVLKVEFSGIALDLGAENAMHENASIRSPWQQAYGSKRPPDFRPDNFVFRRSGESLKAE